MKMFHSPLISSKMHKKSSKVNVWAKKTPKLDKRANLWGSWMAKLGWKFPFSSLNSGVSSSHLEHIYRRGKLLHKPWDVPTSLMALSLTGGVFLLESPKGQSLDLFYSWYTSMI